MAVTQLHEYKGAGKHPKFKHVYLIQSLKDKSFCYKFVISSKGKTLGKVYKTDREAALAADMYLIKHGKQPVNILKKSGV